MAPVPVEIPPPSAARDSFAERHPLLAYFMEYKSAGWRIPLLLAMVTVRHSPVLLMPIYIAYVLDRVVPTNDTTGLWLCLLGMASLLITNVAIAPLSGRLHSRLKREVALRLRSRLCTRIQHLTFSYHDGAQSGRLHSKIMQDVEKTEQLANFAVESFFLPLQTALFSVAAVILHEPRFLYVVALFLPIAFVQHMVMKNRVEEKFRHLRQEQEKLNAEVNEMIVMLPLSRAHATEDVDLRKVGEALLGVRNVGLQTDWRAAILGSQIWATSQLISILVVILGGYFAMRGELTIGQVVMFVSYVGMTVGNIAGIMSQLPILHAGAEAMRSIHEVLHHPAIEENDGKPDLPLLRGHMEFDKVGFVYPGTERRVLDGLSLDVQPTQRIALVGSSGAGKTTFVKLLLGLYLPTDGDVRVDGRPIRDFNLRSLRRQVGIVTQETFLFNGTIQQNLTHGLGDVPQDQVETAARQAHAHDFISQLERGYQTEIGDRGLRLSGGQKQRIAIARALLRNPRLLILDEATSALDSESEKVVQSALEVLMEGRTTFIIAHRLSTVRSADRILVFDRGRIVEDGSHEQLIRLKGVYAHLVALQNIA